MQSYAIRRRVQDLKRVSPVASVIRRAQHRDLRHADVLLASYPKSGNTWIRFMLGQLIAGREVTWDDLGYFVPMVGRIDDAQACLHGDSRLVKTHDLRIRSYRTPGRRAVYLVRDGRDVAVSYYHHQLGEGTFEGSFSAFLDRFLEGRVDRFGSWPQHVRSWASGNGPPTVRQLRYEDVLSDPVSSLEAICSFIGLEAEHRRIERVVRDNGRDRMRSKEGNSSYLDSRRVRDVPFVRAARANTWRETFTPHDNERFLDVAGDVLELLGYAT